MWMKLLTDAIAAAGRPGKQKIANELGISRSQVSRVISGSYGASTDHIAKKVMERYGRIECPHLGTGITQEQCTQNHTRPAPTSSPREMKHWRACQTCSHNTNKG